MLIDKLRVDFKSGKGGSGAVHFYKNGKPSGGNGGNGGNVYLEGTNNLYDLKSLKKEKLYKAEDGEMGGANQLKGADGEDIVIKVPLTTVIYTLNNEVIGKIDQAGQRILLLEGGRGGRGNYEYRAGQVATLKKFTPGVKGSEVKVFLELQLSADVLFIGFPNAGKSSMLNALTNASVAVAAYPFTTLQPHLGVAENIVLMDLPGLIEGAAQGKGLGTKFVRHTQNAKFVAHFVSLENEDMKDTYVKMRDELKDIDERLYDLPEIILLTKADMFDEDAIAMKLKELDFTGKELVVVSAFKRETLKDLTKKLQQRLFG
ncbi:Obg family GTPase CgtA [Candidatus Dojkabacteria bacterium]|uniref:Obg family GTPase CgtA n=1 Tax=Candidatus Dojkabacteria bacterium TaxID=2099670 RepID=A0A955L859_9BACT|nr:Obg family GTPase CgtA [Candidatus Dojkabacteria bacterium]